LAQIKGKGIDQRLRLSVSLPQFWNRSDTPRLSTSRGFKDRRKGFSETNALNY